MKVLILLSLFICQNAWSWGAKGHRVVARIAEKNLSLSAQEEIGKLLDGKTLTKVSVKADIIKFFPKWNHTKPWHYINISEGEEFSSVEHDHDGDVVTSIKQMISILKDQKSTLIDKRQALIFLVHFVGDIHQPLHVGREEDRGGNLLKLLFEGKKTNLHVLWDKGLLSKITMNYKKYADHLETLSPKVMIEEFTEFPFETVVQECTTAHKAIYDFQKNPKGPIELDMEYFTRNNELMDVQLLKAGKRLATLLNHLFPTPQLLKN